MKNVTKTTRTRPLKSTLMGDQWKERQQRISKGGKVQRGKARMSNRNQWEEEA